MYAKIFPTSKSGIGLETSKIVASPLISADSHSKQQLGSILKEQLLKRKKYFF